MNLRASTNQTLVDICLQATGGVNKLIDFALENGLTLTEYLQPGDELMTALRPESKLIVEYYQKNNIRPVSNNLAFVANIADQEVVPITENDTSNKLMAVKQQSMADLCLQATGSADHIIDFAMANNVSITDLPASGNYYAPVEVKNQLVFDYYQTNDIRPITFENEKGVSETTLSGLFVGDRLLYIKDNAIILN